MSRGSWRMAIHKNALAAGIMRCGLCESEEAHNFHHFIPRTVHTNKWFKRRFTREEMAAGIDVCKACHKAIHRMIPDKKELGRQYNTIDRLLAHPEIAKYVRWKKLRRPGQEFSSP